jgi:hypothetical protein
VSTGEIIKDNNRRHISLLAFFLPISLSRRYINHLFSLLFTTDKMFRELLLVLFITFHLSTTALSVAPSPPLWPSVWMATGSAHDLLNNETVSIQIFYDWTRPAQVMNLMREDSYTYTIMHNGTTVWRLERANRSCCIDPNHTGVTPPRPGKNKMHFTSILSCSFFY